jgi:hypothetical protein
VISQSFAVDSDTLPGPDITAPPPPYFDFPPRARRFALPISRDAA